MLKARVYTSVSFSKQVFPLFAIIEVNNFILPEGARGGRCVAWGYALFIRLKPVHGNYQTKRTDNSAGRESLYGNSFCSPNRLSRHEKLKFGQVLYFL